MAKRAPSFALLILTAIICVGFLSRADDMAQSCKARPVKDELVNGRASTITFPDGRKITVVGHLHGDRQIYEISELESSGKLATMSNDEFDALVAKILKDNTAPNETLLLNSNRRKAATKLAERGLDGAKYFNSDDGFDLQDMTVLNHARQDYQFVSKQIANQTTLPTVQFIGYEGTDQTWADNFPYYLRAQQSVLNQFAVRKSRGLSTTESEIKDAILSGSNGSIYAFMQNPNLIERVPMIGVENADAGKRYDEAEPLEKIEKAMKALSDADDAYWDTRPTEELDVFKRNPENLRFVALLSQLDNEVVGMEITSISGLERKFEILNQHTFPWVEEPLNHLFESYRTRVQLNLDRDFNSASNLVSLKLSGIHFVGLNHFRTTLKNLEQMCSSERTAPAHSGQP